MKKIIIYILAITITLTCVGCSDFNLKELNIPKFKLNVKANLEIENNSEDSILPENIDLGEYTVDSEKISEELLILLEEIPNIVQSGSAGSSLKTVLAAEKINEFISEHPEENELLGPTLDYFFNEYIKEKNIEFEGESYNDVAVFFSEMLKDINIDVVNDNIVETIEDAGLSLTSFDWNPEVIEGMQLFTEKIKEYVNY